MIDNVGRGGPMRPPNLGAEPLARAAEARSGLTPVARGGIAPASMVGSARAGAGQVVRDMAARPPVDTARVDALRTAIAAGTYKVDPQAIAARMIALEQGSGRK